jgi:hypothetical protein
MTIVLLFLAVLVAREYFIQRERDQWASERSELLQRIQAPEVAVVDHSRGEDWEAPDPSPAMSDEDLWKLMRSID